MGSCTLQIFIVTTTIIYFKINNALRYFFQTFTNVTVTLFFFPYRDIFLYRDMIYSFPFFTKLHLICLIRERITKSWYLLRQLLPNCDSYADKAAVFEMSVAYLHHCWKYHGPILQQINKVISYLKNEYM